MHGRTDVHAEGGRRGAQQVPALIQLVQQGIQKDGDGAEHNNGGDGNGHILATPPDDGFGRHHGRRAADRAARADQNGAVAFQLEHLGAEEHGQAKRGRQHQRIDGDAGQPDLADILEGQAEAVQDDAESQ
ncbi:hypothetical protein D3C72_1765040 [compost metagenome]